MPETPSALEGLVRSMLHPDPKSRPTATVLLQTECESIAPTSLVSAEQMQLLLEKNKVRAANMALDVQMERMKKISPPRRKLIRHNTWNGGF